MINQNIKLNIIYEDEYIIIINKPHGIIVHPGAGNFNGTIMDNLLSYYPPICHVPRAGIIHRLDKNTTGLMLIAKTPIIQSILAQLLYERKIIREYEAISIGNIITGGTIKQPICRHTIKRTSMSVCSVGGKMAITHYRVIEKFREHTYLRLRLETGRTHQIRVHLAYINHPLVGDLVYNRYCRIPKGGSKVFKKILYDFNRQALHATMLQFFHPITLVKMKWKIPLPQDMLNLIFALKDDIKSNKN